MSFLSKRLMGGWTELHVAAEAGDLARVRQAVQRSPADIDKRTAKVRERGRPGLARHMPSNAVEL